MGRPIAIDPDELREYSLKGDDSESPVIYILGVMTPSIKAKLNDTAMNWSVKTNAEPEEKGNVHSHLCIRNVEIVRWGLRGWKGLKDKKGNDVPFPFIATPAPGRHGTLNIASQRALDMMESEDVDELARELVPQTFITAAEEKN